MTKTISIAFNDGSESESVDAEYYMIEGDWITFKSDAHKVVAAYREARVDRLLAPGAQTHTSVNGRTCQCGAEHWR